MPTLSEQLAAHLEGKAAPFLFVGAGLSRRYLGLDDWPGLLRRFAIAAGQDYDRVSSSVDGDYPAIATAIADAFHDAWWDGDEYAASRTVYGPGLARRESPLKVEVAKYVEESLRNLDEDGPYRDEIGLLKHVQVDGIITTNYDGLLEQLFPGFEPFVGQDELLFSETQGIGEIYKIHGSYSDPDSLVLTADDYQDFNRRNAYLAAKLLTIFVDHPVVFLGYSMQDKNVISILTSIASGLTREHLGKLRDRLVFIEWDPAGTDPVLAPSTFSLDGSGVPVQTAQVADFTEVYEALGTVRRTFSVRHLRLLKEQVYDLVKTTDPVGALRVIGLDDATEASDIKVVAGVGPRMSEIGLVGLERHHLIDDVLLGTGHYPPAEVVELALPQLLSRTPVVPMFKYLRGAGLLDDDGALRDPNEVRTAVADRMASGLTPLDCSNPWYRDNGPRVAAEVGDFAGLLAKEGEHSFRVLMFLRALPDDGQDPAALQEFLLDYRAHFDGKIPYESDWAKAVCFYDWLVNGKAPT